MKIELKGIEQFKRELGKVKSEITRDIERVTSASLLRIQSGAKRRAPVNKKKGLGGAGRASIHTRQQGTNGEVIVNNKYMAYQEWGTGNLVSVPDEMKELAEEFRGRGVRSVNLPAQPFLWPSFVEERPKYIRNLKTVLGKGRAL